MFTCIPCLRPRGLVSEITYQIKDISLKVGKMHKRMKRSTEHQKDATMAMEVKEGPSKEEQEEWVAEADPGVLITLVSLPDGSNCIKKIRFREEIFDPRAAQKWWNDNCDKVMELYSVRRSHSSITPAVSEDECPIDSSETQEYEESSNTSRKSSDSPPQTPKLDLHSKKPMGEEGSTTIPRGTQGKLVEWVVEDEPGVFVTVSSLPDASREIRRVELSRERFGEVKARVWWEENKARLHEQYT